MKTKFHQQAAIAALFRAVFFVAALTLAGRAAAANYFLSDFTSAAETNLGVPPSVWEYNNTDKAPWTAGWDNASSLVFNFGQPIAPGENQRLRAPLTAPLPAFSAYPYTKVKVTFSGIPAGQTVLFQIREEVAAGGYIKRTWPVGNGTAVYTFDATDVPSFDGGSNTVYSASTDTYSRVRLQIDLTTIATYVTDYANVHASIDYVVITDDIHYGDAPPTQTPPVIKGSGVVAVGQTLQLSAQFTGTGTTTYAWSRNAQAIPGGTDGNLRISPVTFGDAGQYVVTATDQSKATYTSAPFTLSVVPQLPLSSATMLIAAVTVLALAGAWRLRRPVPSS